jgi:hypothetical protein
MDYSQHVVHQVTQSALCNRFHDSAQRLARWLLLTAERAEANRFELTHEFVAQMVGAPRSAVSAAAAALRSKGIIEYRRGVLTIKNPAKLHKVACECFDNLSWQNGWSAASQSPASPSNRLERRKASSRGPRSSG